MSGKLLRRTAFAGAAFFVSSSTSALAGEEVLMRTDMEFHACPGVIESMLNSLGADKSRVALMTNTGAHYKVKLISAEANLVFLCNSVARQITVTRTTPGELITAQK
ncbi:MAG: hypothetical protein AAFR27_01400 [Pseudomonadota bacterium]